MLGWDALRGYQQRAAQRLASRQAVGLWMAAGVGKTATALAAWALNPVKPVLIVTKAIGRHVWPRDARWVLGEEHPVSVLWAGSARTKSGTHRDGTFSSLEKALEHSEIVATNYEVLGARYAELIAVPWAYLILDEAHEIKMGFAPPQKYRDGSVKRRRYEYALDLARSVQMRGGYVWEITATPVRDRRRDLYGQLNVVLPHQIGGAWDWLHYYCAAKPGRWGGLDTTGESHTEELRDVLRQYFVMETRASIADELPPVQRDVRTVTVDRECREHMGGGVEEAIARAAAAKTPVALDLVIEYLAQGGKVVVVTPRRALAHSFYRQAVAVLDKELPRKARSRVWSQVTTGEDDVILRSRLAEDYNARDDYALLVATMDSVMTSIDLQQSDGLIMTSVPLTPYGIAQMEGRVGRVGGRPVTIHYLIAEGTIDERARELVLDKLDDVRALETDTQGATGAGDALLHLRDEGEILSELRQWLQQCGG